MSDALSRMTEALGLEIAAIQERGGGTQLELRGGERLHELEGSWLYRFLLVEDPNLRDETPVRVTAGQEDVPGMLVSFKDGVLLVALEKDLGPKIAIARLTTDDSFLIERLKGRLEEVQSGESQFARASAARTLGLTEPHVGDAAPHASVTRDGLSNTDQLRAIRRSLGSDTTFVWGPPGTGKTTTLARIVEAHYREGRSVLLVSNTNIAVDTALQQVCERLEGETDFHRGLVIRQGPVVKEELRRIFGPQVILEQIVARLGEALRRKRDELKAEEERLEDERGRLGKVLEHYERRAKLKETVAAQERAWRAARSDASGRKQEAERHQEVANALADDLERAREMGAVRRFFQGLKPERLERDIAAAVQSAGAAEDAAKAMAERAARIERELASLREQLGRTLKVAARHPPEAETRTRMKALQGRLRKIRERITAIGQQLDELREQVLERCRILATTVYRTYLGKGAPRQFDAVVIDEASMLMPPLVYYAAGLAKESVTVAGDFRQLPPIVMSRGGLTEDWLSCDVFEKAGIRSRVEQRRSPPHLVALGTQYRMREPICALINNLFYPDHPLETHESVEWGADGFPLGSDPLLYVDTSDFHPWAARPVGSYSRYNLFHALLIRNLVLHLAETGFLPPSGEPNDAVGAVAPYASQARLIQTLLDDRLGDRAAGVAATVHRFQGNEKRAMLLDLTDSHGCPLGMFLQATDMKEDGARLLNVATSRARQHVILVGNFRYLRRKAPPSGYVRRLIEHFGEHGRALDLNDLLPLSEHDWVDGLHSMLAPSFDLPEGAAGAFTEGTFYPAFSTDLSRARESAVIFSPFATAAGTGRWIEPLRAALARGVRARIVTKPADEWGGGGTEEVTELVEELRNLGIVVDLRARMHEKFAILDRRILWHGSLNILSHRDTHESMLRIESRAACAQVARFLSTPVGGRDEETTGLADVENPSCPECGAGTVWKMGRYGIWFECEDPDCDGKVDHGRRRGRHRRGGERDATGSTRGRGGDRSGVDFRGRPCPRAGCGGRLRRRNGRYGPFLGCSNYPRCRYTENLG